MGVIRVPVLSPNGDPNPYQFGQKVFGKSQSFEIFQLPLSSLNTALNTPTAQFWDRKSFKWTVWVCRGHMLSGQRCE